MLAKLLTLDTDNNLLLHVCSRMSLLKINIYDYAMKIRYILQLKSSDIQIGFRPDGEVHFVKGIVLLFILMGSSLVVILLASSNVTCTFFGSFYT